MGKHLFYLLSFFAFFSFHTQVFSQTRTVTVRGNTTWSSLFNPATTSSQDIVILTKDDEPNTLTIDIAQVNCRSLTIGVRNEDDDEGGLNIVLNGNTINVTQDFTFYHADEEDRKLTINIGAGTLLVGGNLSITDCKEDNNKNSISISSGTLKVGGQWTMGKGTSFTAGTGLVEFTGSAPQTLPNVRYANLSCSGTGTKIFPALSTKASPTVTDNPIWAIQDLKIYAGATVSLGYNDDIPAVGNRAYRAAKLYLWETDRLVGQNTGSCKGSGTRNPDPFPSAVQKAALGSSVGVIEITQAALPVTLSSFTAKQTPDNKVSLGWVTSTESLNKGFRIERQAGNENGKFEQIGFVGSKAKNGNSQNSLTYNFIDAAPKVGVPSFYRLVQEDLDGKLTYNDVRVVKLNGQGVSMVFPNPSNGSVNISRNAGGKKMNVQVIDLSGKIIRQANNITDANYRLNIPQSGVYTIKMISPETGEQSTQRIVVQK
ncbi:MAG: hypothetical protein RJB31_527 [Bacteroidota bacterium]